MIASRPGATAASFWARRSREPATARWSMVEVSPAGTSVSASITSMGSDRKTGPEGAAAQSWKARAEQDRDLVRARHLARTTSSRVGDGHEVAHQQRVV